MTYKETLDYLFKQLPMYQKIGKSAFKKDLSNTLALCNLLDDPHHKFKSIHIAGTNGKGSTAHMLASIFQEAGYKTGLYTSPHLKDFRERVRINGKPISEKTIVEFVAKFQNDFIGIQPSFFEWTVALAFHVFAEEKVDIAIIETGLGGRLDSTNVITPELSVITNISLDHVDMLGNTLDKIAKEKAGIIKPEIPVIVGNHSEQKNVFLEKANETKSPIFFGNDFLENLNFETDLLGNYQKWNIKTVYLAFLQLQKQGWKIDQKQLENGLNNVVSNTGLRGRWEIIKDKPKTIAETAHNEGGLRSAMAQLSKYDLNNIHFVIGFVSDKNLNDVLDLFPKESNYYFCAANVQRALNVNDLKLKANQKSLKGEAYPSVKLALEAANKKAKPTDIIYVGGSNFVVAEML